MSADTANQLLDCAERLVVERGFNAFSYRDLAEEVGIRAASIHYHFPSKGDLGAALMQRYTERLDDALAVLEGRTTSERARLLGFVELYRATGERGAICLCGSLASDLATLPDALRPAVQGYLERSITWVESAVRRGRAAGEFSGVLEARALAESLVAGLQGALLVARAQGSAEVLEHIAAIVLRRL